MIRIMKIRILTFSSILCLSGATCGAAQMYGTPLDEMPAGVSIGYGAPAQYIYETPIPMRSVKALSVKPVAADTRAPVWDGTRGQYRPRGGDKTVDWRDGVPIWDDSIVNYRDKDFSDWFLEPMPIVYMEEVDTITPISAPANATDVQIAEIYAQNMKDAADTRARIEELLAPQKPTANMWAAGDGNADSAPKYAAQDMTEIVAVAFADTDGCPFETEKECEIWRKKPVMRETVSPRSPRIRDANMLEFINAAKCDNEISANDKIAAPLLQRYKMLMRSASACCTDGMAYSLRAAGASDGLVYKFLADDANFYGLGARCLMMTDAELDEKYPNTATAAVAADVRNGCLCRGRQWFEAMLAPFKTVYEAAPEFASQKFYYKYTDGLQREITVSVNADVQNVLNQLALCP